MFMRVEVIVLFNVMFKFSLVFLLVLYAVIWHSESEDVPSVYGGESAVAVSVYLSMGDVTQ